MKKENVQLLMKCMEGDDQELARYAKEKLTELGIVYKINSEEEGRRFKDYEIYELYNSDDLYLSTKSRELTIRYYDRYIYYVIEVYFKGFKEYTEDLYQCGVVGFLKALRHYDGNHPLSLYSRLYLIHEMKGFAYYLQHIPSPHYARIRNKIRNLENFYEINGIQPEIDKISKDTGIEVEKIKNGKNLLELSNSIHLDEINVEQAELMICPDETENIVEKTVFEKIEQEKWIAILSKLPKHQGRIIYLKIWKEYSFKEIAEIMQMDKKKVYKLYCSGILKLAKKVKKHMILS